MKAGSAHCVLCVERIKGALRRGIATRPDHDPACAVAGACDGDCRRAKGSCCGSNAAAKPEATAARRESCCARGDGEKKPSWPGPSISALSCKGLQQLLTMTLPPPPPARIAEIVLSEPAEFVPWPPKDVVYPSRTLDVPKPPPRA